MVIILLSPSLRGRARRLPRALRALAMTKHGHYVIARKDACPLEAIPPTHVIARSAEGTTKQSLFFSTIGSSIRLGPRDRRLPRALRALAMTDREKIATDPSGPRNNRQGVIRDLAMAEDIIYRFYFSLFNTGMLFIFSYAKIEEDEDLFIIEMLHTTSL